MDLAQREASASGSLSTKDLLQAQLHDRGARASMMRLGLAKRGAVRRSAQVFVDGLLECARPDSVYDSHFGTIRQVGLVEELLELTQRIAGPHPDYIKLVALARRRNDRHLGLARGRRDCPRAPQTLGRDLDPESATADDRASRFERDQLSANITEFDRVTDLERFSFERVLTRWHDAVQLTDRFGERTAQFALALGAGFYFREHGRAFAPQFLDNAETFAANALALGVRPGARPIRRPRHFALALFQFLLALVQAVGLRTHPRAFGFEAVQRLGKFGAAGGECGFCRAYDFAGQSQPARDGEPVTLPYRMRLQAIERRQPIGVEVDRGGLEARARVGVELDRRRMGRDRDRTSVSAEVIHQADRERGAFDRVGSATWFF